MAAAIDKPEPAVLPTGYYLDNFEIVLREVEERYADLLALPEREFLRDFSELSLGARRLYVRLSSRRGPWFRSDRLRYPEIEDGAPEELLAAGFAAEGGEEEIAARMALLVRPELLAAAAELDCDLLRHCRGLARSELGAAVGAAIARADGAAAAAARFPILRLLRCEPVRVFRLLFFGNLAQDWTEFVLADLGVVRFESYSPPAGERLFATRAVLERHLELRRAAEQLERSLAGDELDSTAAAVAPLLAGECDRGARRLRDQLAIAVARALERRGGNADLEAALELYAAAGAAPSRERRIRILRHLERRDEASALLAQVRAAPLDESERIFAERDERGRRRRRPIPERSLVAARGDGVERTALEALAAEGFRGFFAENWLWRSLFGLAFWDIVFAPIPGAFTHRFQYGPRDLYDGFRAAREEAISARIEALRVEPRLPAALLARWDEKYGVANRLVAFAAQLRPHLELALESVAGPQFAAVADRLSRDLRRYASGFPDLFLVGPGGDILLAEVKGPGDVLRPEQESWLEYLNDHGLPAVVLQVRWAT